MTFKRTIQIAIIAAIFIFGANLPSHAQSSGKLRIAVTLPDLAPIVKTLGEDRVEILEVMPPGADPHGFTLTAEALETIETCDLLIFANSEFLTFESELADALGDVDSIDWPDYAHFGAELKSFPGYDENPHGFWLGFDNIKAIARGIAEGLVNNGLEFDLVSGNLINFLGEIDAADKAGKDLFIDLGRERSVWAAMVPGVLYTIDNLGLGAGEVVYSEGAGFASGRELFEMQEKLRSGEYTGLVCPLSMREAKAGEMAEQMSRDTGAPVCYVRFLDAKAGDSYLAQASYNAGAMSAAAARSAALRASDGSSAAGHIVWGVVVAILLIAIIMQNKRIYYSGGSMAGGAGIFEKKKKKQ